MESNMNYSEIMATVLPVPDDVLKEEMRRYWKGLKKWMIIGLIICFIGIILLCIGLKLLTKETQLQEENLYPAIMFFSLGFVVLLCDIYPLVMNLINYCKLLYRYWNYIGTKKGYSAGQMVGFMFIPFFNFYWQFVAIWGLAKKLNAMGAKCVKPSLALAYCILSCCAIIPQLKCAIIPQLKTIASIVSIVLFFIIFGQFNKAFTESPEA